MSVYTYALEYINTSKLSIKGPKHVQVFISHEAKSTSQKTQNRLLMKATPQMLIKKSNRNLLVEKTKTAPLKMYNANLKVNQFNQT